MTMSNAGFAAMILSVASLTMVQAQAADATAEPGAAPVAATAPAKKLSYTDDYRIAVNHDADSDGVIVFRVTPKDGTPQDINVAVKKGTSENEVARTIKKAFEEQLGTKQQSIEMEDGENVIIERSMGNDDISLVLVSSTVKGVTVKIHWD
jgi:hypothetical protein